MTCCQILYLVFVQEKYNNCNEAVEPTSIELLSPLLSDSSQGC